VTRGARWAGFVLTLLLAAAYISPRSSVAFQRKLDPSAWGSTHVGQSVPAFVPGDECLFCHRSTIGVTWKDSSHGAAVRHREDAPALARAIEAEPRLAAVAREAEYFLGSRHRVRLLKQERYGTFSVLGAQVALDAGKGIERVIDPDNQRWDSEIFSNRCTGCHSTGVETATKTFSVFGLDCYTCHGDVTLDHTSDTSLIWWSAKRRNATGFLDVQGMTSICAQCHLRGGRSRSTLSPYPNTFVAGDNLFKDFDVDFARADDPALNAGDRHVWRNVREVAVDGDGTLTCNTCHRVHAASTAKHKLIPPTPLCRECHDMDGVKVRTTKGYVVDNSTCDLKF
jgi:predicted CXXCH cytochrome family protein